MAADSQVNIALKVTADTKGGEEVKSSIDDIGKAAKTTATQAQTSAGVFKTAFTGVGNAVSLCSKAIAGVTKALGLFGFAVNAVQMLVDVFHKLHDWIHRDEIAAAKLAEEIRRQKYAESVAAAAKAYESLNKSVSENLKMEREKNALIDARTGQDRSLEDEKLNLAEAKELDAVDPNDPDAASKRELISIKYGRKRSELAAKRADEDTRNEVKRLSAEESAKRAEAEGYRQQMQGAAGRNVDEKRRDYEVTKRKAQSGDKKAAEKLSEIEKQLDEAIAAYKKLKEAAEAAEKEAESLHERMLVASNGDRAAWVRNQTNQQQLNTQERDARNGMERAQRERQAQEEERKRKEAERQEAARKQAAEISDAQAAHRALSAQRASLIGQIDAQRGSKFAANYAVYQAQGDYDLAAANGSRGARALPAAQQALTEAQNAALNVNHAADSAINALKETLNSVEARLKATQSYLERQSKQTRNAWSETPSGV